MKSRIAEVLPGGIGEELGFEKGDILLSINGTKVEDILDYRFLLADEYVEVEILKPNKEVWEFEIEKEYGEDLGVEFEEAILDKAKSCTNKCIFCFIDQLPKGMRKTLYFKDDDSRLSFLQGNFVTLTNMKDEDIDRIIKYRISPINVSVHTTNPDLRKKILNNRFAGNVYERLQKLAAAGINNGDELVRTVEDLYKLRPSIENVAAVPIGITKFREGLADLEIYNKETAKEELDRIKVLQEKYMKEIGSPFVRLSDEFYVMADEEVPNESGKGKFTLITGTSAFKELDQVCTDIREANNNIDIKCKVILNDFFGHTITVAGLLTGQDVIAQLKDNIDSEYLIMADNMFRKGYEPGDITQRIMLDDLTAKDIEERLGVKVIVCSYTGEDLIDLINEHCEEE